MTKNCLLFFAFILLSFFTVLAQDETGADEVTPPGPTTRAQGDASNQTVYKVGDWPQWGGPNGTGCTAETGLYRQWPKDGPKLIWNIKDGRGMGAPAVCGKDVYEEVSEGWGEDEYLYNLDAATGKLKWKVKINASRHDHGWSTGGPRSTPSITEKYVIALGAGGTMCCIDRQSGQKVWSTELFEVYKEDEEPKADWKGFCMSPVICENKVIVHDNWSSPFCVAIDVATGKEAWRWYPPEGAARGAGAAGTPAIMTFGKDSCAVFGYGHGLCALRVSDGKEVWFFLNQKSGGGSRFPPVQMDGDLILNMGQEDSAHMLEVNRKSAPFQSKELWAKELYKFSSEVSPFIPYEGYLYGFGGGTGVQGVRSMNAVTMDLYCVEPKTGKTVWEKRGFKYGCSLCIADGLMFVRSHDTVTLVEATPKDYKELGKLEGFHKEKDSLNDWVQPVVAGGNLYLKTSWSLFCYKVGDFNPAQQGTSRPGVPTSKPQTD